MKKKISMFLFAAMLSITTISSVKAVQVVDTQTITQSSIIHTDGSGPGDPPPM